MIRLIQSVFFGLFMGAMLTVCVWCFIGQVSALETSKNYMSYGLTFITLAVICGLLYHIIIEMRDAIAANDDDDDEVDIDEQEFFAVTATNDDPRPILRALANNFSYKALKVTLLGLEGMWKNAEGLTDPTLVDMQNEETALFTRLIGACDVICSDDFEKWSDKDKEVFKQQVYGMMLYHNNLWARCCRFGVVVEKD